MAVKVLSEGRVKITVDVIKRAVARRERGARTILRDAETPGLALIINPETSTWVFAYRPRGTDPRTGRRWPNKTVTLGNPSSLSIEDARHAAAAMKGQAATGDDPHAARKEKLARAASDRASTTMRLVEDYQKALPLRPKLRGTGTPSAAHVSDEVAHVRAALTTMNAGTVPIGKLDATHLRALLTAEASRPATARARFGALSRFMDWAQDEGQVKVNPCLAVARTRRPRPPPARANYLSPVQLAVLWKAAGKLDPLYRDLVRFLIALPCRRGEAAEVDWSHIDLAGATWSQPGLVTKNGEPHRLHLHPAALAIVVARHKAAKQPKAGLVFPAPRSGKSIDTFTDIKSQLDKHSGLTGWTWHDFRRSFASVLGELGLPEPVLDACLNHRQSATRSGVLGVYQRAQRWPEQVSAIKAWGAALQTEIEGRSPDNNVVEMKAGR